MSNFYIVYIISFNVYILINLLLILQIEGCLTVQNLTVPYLSVSVQFVK